MKDIAEFAARPLAKPFGRIVYWAIQLNNLTTVTQALFYLQMPPSYFCYSRRNLLTASVYKNIASILGYLLQFRYVSTSGVDISSDLLNQDRYGNTALHYAYAFNYTNAVLKMQAYFSKNEKLQQKYSKTL